MTRYIILIITVCALFSCDDFIDKTPVDQIPVDEYFDDTQSAESAVLGIYRSAQSVYYYGQSMIVIPEFAAGHLVHASGFPEYVNFGQNNIRIDNPWVLNIWTASYSIINAANNVIEKVPQIPNFSSDSLQMQLIREAKFMRALTYFNLVRSWGDVPLITTPTTAESEVNLPRTPADQVYAKIIEDLQDAVLLPASYKSSVLINKGRASRAAAKALLAKVYLYTENYAQAAALAGEVINSGYTLTPEYGSIWLTENSTESIFELQFDEQATNPLAGVSNPIGSALFFAADTVYKMFEGGDKRRDFTVNLNNGKYYIGKYRNANPATQNVPVIRLSEVYLIYAEALARVNNSPAGDPYFYYKAIRDRAGLTTPEENTFDLNSFVTAVQHEKRLELMFEGEAWYDYTRTDLALTEMMQVSDPERYLFPVPQIERELNTQLDQNDAYL